MLIFNTTFHVDDIVEKQFVEFIKTSYVPQALKNPLVQNASLAKIETIHEENGVSYAMQLRTSDIDSLDQWIEETGEALSRELYQHFGQKVNGFVTLMEEISLD